MSRVIIFGGTGTLGSKLVERLHLDRSVTVFSRDELKQQELRAKYPKVRYVIGDIRDRSSVEQAMKGHSTAFHVAALKHIDVVEDNAHEAIQTNIHGSLNIAHAALLHDVEDVVFSSTDKAVLPVNIYGHTKAIIERYYLYANRKQITTNFRVFRWGNVIGSRGSVVHSFVKTLKEEGKIYLTDPNMTRFWIHIDDAVDFMLTTLGGHVPQRVIFPEMKACSIKRLADAIARNLGIEYEIGIIGMRPGEKIHECLESNHHFCLRSDTAPQLTDDELDAMLRRVL